MRTFQHGAFFIIFHRQSLYIPYLNYICLLWIQNVENDKWLISFMIACLYKYSYINLSTHIFFFFELSPLPEAPYLECNLCVCVGEEWNISILQTFITIILIFIRVYPKTHMQLHTETFTDNAACRGNKKQCIMVH